MPSDRDFLTTSEVCEILGGLDRSTVNRWVQIGKLKPAHKLPGLRGANLFARTDIDALAEEYAARAQVDGPVVASAEHGP